MTNEIYDPFDYAIERELAGEPLLWDEWEDLLDELAEEDSVAEQLAERLGISFADLKQATESACLAYRAQRETLPAHGYRATLAICQGLHDAPSAGKLRFFCQFLNEVDAFPPEDFDTEDDYWGYQFVKLYEARRDALYLEDLRRNRRRFLQLLPALKAPLPVGEADFELGELFDFVGDSFGTKAQTESMERNLYSLVQSAYASEALHSVAPLFLYQMLVRHASRLQKSEDIHFQMEALWQRQDYAIDHDNGKNFAQYSDYLTLFENFCAWFTDDPVVDLPLCKAGFVVLSNLAKFYHEDGEGNPKFLPQPLRLWVEEHVFSCFPLGLDGSVIFPRYNLDVRELDAFREASRYQRPLKRLSRYMNQHAEPLFQAYLETQDLVALGDEVLRQCRVRPASEKERHYYLCAIEWGLRDLTDYLAERALTESLEAWMLADEGAEELTAEGF